MTEYEEKSLALLEKINDALINMDRNLAQLGEVVHGVVLRQEQAQEQLREMSKMSSDFLRRP